MAVSPFFKHIDSSEEQDLYHSLAAELIHLSGIDCYYLKVEQLESKSYDELFGENRFEQLKDKTKIEMYLKDFEQPYGNEEIYSKFGIYQPFSCTFLVSIRRFVSLFDHRPREGDYVYIPNWSYGPNSIFRIVKVDVTDMQFMALGSPVYFFLKCEKAIFNHQDVRTNLEDLEQNMVNGDISQEKEPNSDNDILEKLSKDFIDFSEENLFGKP